MATSRGPLLRRWLDRLGSAHTADEVRAIEGRGGVVDAEVPVLLQLEATAPSADSWDSHSDRLFSDLDDLRSRLEGLSSSRPRLLRAARTIAFTIPIEGIDQVEKLPGFRFLELDQPGSVFCLDETALDLGLPLLTAGHPTLDGRGVRIAVLDTGIDGSHPALHVDEAVSTCGENVGIPGSHGTAVAGCLASSDSIFRGVAPGVTLVDIKVGSAVAQVATPSTVLAGIDEALDRRADVLSMSLGFNQLPQWWDGGFGWGCPDGRCPLCAAVDEATAHGAVVVAAAGNDHQRAEALRQNGFAAYVPTELSCPGQARECTTVSALHKQSFVTWARSSRGPATHGPRGPSIATAGVDVMTTIPVPRDSSGAPVPGPSRASLFSRATGTSLATPLVAGAVALLIQQHREQVLPWTPASIRRALTTVCCLPSGAPDETGAGRLELSAL